MVCCFFGHRDTPETVRGALETAIRQLIEQDGADCFLMGHQGAFDRMALSVLRRLKRDHPQISYFVVLAYLPGKAAEEPLYDPAETLYPEGLETIPRRYAISWRNKWLIRNSDVVVTYITHSWGGAAQFAALAERQKKRVLNLAK